MSAAALHITNNQIILCSDGILMNGDEVLGTNCRKVYKVSGSVGFAWLGLWSDQLEKKILNDLTGLTSVREATDRASGVLRQNTTEHQFKDFNTWLFFVGYENGELTGSMIWSKNSGYDPVEIPLCPGLIGGKFYDNEGDLMEQRFCDLLTEGLPRYPDAEGAVRESFTKTVSEAKKCGGQIFIETLTKTQ